MKKNKLGFTLIELLIVIAIIGLLSTLSVLALNQARIKSRDTKRVADVKQMMTALEMYYSDNNAYPSSSTSTAHGGSIGSGTVTYLKIIPTPPTTADGTCAAATDYTYYSTGNNTYTISYCLGSAVSDITAGNHTSTPASIQ